MPVSALTIAGSDPSGGAGIQQDLKVFAALGVAGLSAITAITVQNSLGVRSVHPVDADILFRQIEALLTDSAVNAVKIGMLGGAEQVHAVVKALRRFRPPNVVLDPVLASSDGVPLLDDAGRSALKRELIPLADIVTPNLSEASALTDLVVDDMASGWAAGEALLWLGTRAVLVKGGHLDEIAADTLIDLDGRRLVLADARIDTPHTHGTGCFLSSAISAHLALGCTLKQAAERAKSLLTRGLTLPVVAGAGRGYPDAFPASRTPSLEMKSHVELLEQLRGIYVISDSTIRDRRDHQVIIPAVLRGGARVVQLREKQAPADRFVRSARAMVASARKAMGLAIVNDRVDIALAVYADGVHLGPDDMHPADARRILGPDKLIGVSAGTVEEAAPLAQYASYFGVGAVFGSTTKTDAGPPVGLDRIGEFKRAFPDHPIVAIGGINVDNIEQVAAAGADAAAVISAVVCADDMERAVRDLIVRFERGNKGR